MKKYTWFLIFSLALLFAATGAHAQFGGFTGPGLFYQPQGIPPQDSTGQQMGWWPQGFTGQFTPVSVSQVYSFPDRAPAVLRGSIVGWIGKDRYIFRDGSGDIMIHIKMQTWWGMTVGPNDIVELTGELKRHKGSWMIDHFCIWTIRPAM